MTTKLYDRLSAWLEQERAGTEAGAEQALRRLFVALPLQSPPARFAERVMLAVVEPPWSQRLFAHLWVRAAIVVTLALGALALFLVPPALLALLGVVEMDGALTALVGLVVGMAGFIDRGLEVVRVLADVGGALALAFSTPEVLIPTVIGLLVSAISFRFLLAMAPWGGSLAHAESTRSF